MNVRDKIIFVTGGANGIGRALGERFASEGAKKIIVADIDFKNARTVAGEIDGKAIRLDVSNEAQVKTAVEEVLDEFGQIDLVCSNAGIGGAEGGLDVSNKVWQEIYEINVLSHLYLSRAVFPAMLKRDAGYF
jgi:NAD(P)-dependent dehydrogenase (short-subunit alcohol dehydrogenase family)